MPKPWGYTTNTTHIHAYNLGLSRVLLLPVLRGLKPNPPWVAFRSSERQLGLDKARQGDPLMHAVLLEGRTEDRKCTLVLSFALWCSDSASKKVNTSFGPSTLDQT